MKRGNSRNKKIPNKKLLAFSIGLSVIIVFGLMAYKMFFQTQNVKFSLKAAIIDQLSQHFPNETFKNEATDLLRDIGFNVSYFGSEAVNVSFYKELAKSDYGIIILRAHSALRVNETIVDLFTSEKYDESKYSEYQENRLLTEGEYIFEQGPDRFYFAITPKFIENLDGNFPKSIIIAMGCWSLKYSGMAQAFIGKGAKAYIGWTELVLPNDTDHETAKFLEMFLGENKTLADAIAMTDKHYYPSNTTIITSQLDFFPSSPSIGELKISDLIADAKSSKTSATFNNFEQFLFSIVHINFKSKDFQRYKLRPYVNCW
jgi:hypothetical protein